MELRRAVMLVSSAAIAVASSLAVADDWPQWRGAKRDGVWREAGIVEKFDGPQIPIRWRARISTGYSSPTVADGRVYVGDRVIRPEQTERVRCFDAMTGEHRWTHSYGCEYKKVSYKAGPRASVTVHDGLAYSLGTMGHVFCLDAGTGDVVWQKDMNAEYRIRMPVWGIAAAPIVEDDLVIVQIGGRDACVVALDRKTGTERWIALSDRCSYSAPIVIEQAGKRVLVCWTGDGVAGLAPRTGEVYWYHSFKPTRMVINISTPVFDRGRLFMTDFWMGSLMLRLAPDKLAVEAIWSRRGPSEKDTEALHSIISTPILDGDYVYGVDSYGELRCLDARTGERVWESRDAVPRARWANIHFVRHGDNVWMFNEQGELIISKLSPQGFHEASRAKLIDPTPAQLNKRRPVCWSHPAFAYRHIYIRNDRELVCASLAAE